MHRKNKSSVSDNGIRSLPSSGPKKQGKVATGNSSKGVSEKWKKRRGTTKHKKVKDSSENKHSKNSVSL